MHDFTRLEVHRESVSLTAEIYELAKLLPRSEDWGLRANCADLRRRFQQTSPREQAEAPTASSPGFFALSSVRCARWKATSMSPSHADFSTPMTSCQPATTANHYDVASRCSNYEPQTNQRSPRHRERDELGVPGTRYQIPQAQRAASALRLCGTGFRLRLACGVAGLRRTGPAA